jgi:hypothetical protein
LPEMVCPQPVLLVFVLQLVELPIKPSLGQ